MQDFCIKIKVLSIVGDKRKTLTLKKKNEKQKIKKKSNNKHV